MKLLDAYTGELTGELRCGNAKMTNACFTPDGAMVIAGDDSGSVTLYDAKRHQTVIALKNGIRGVPSKIKIETPGKRASGRTWIFSLWLFLGQNFCNSPLALGYRYAKHFVCI